MAISNLTNTSTKTRPLLDIIFSQSSPNGPVFGHPHQSHSCDPRSSLHLVKALDFSMLTHKMFSSYQKFAKIIVRPFLVVTSYDRPMSAHASLTHTNGHNNSNSADTIFVPFHYTRNVHQMLSIPFTTRMAGILLTNFFVMGFFVFLS